VIRSRIYLFRPLLCSPRLAIAGFGARLKSVPLARRSVGRASSSNVDRSLEGTECRRGGDPGRVVRDTVRWRTSLCQQQLRHRTAMGRPRLTGTRVRNGATYRRPQLLRKGKVPTAPKLQYSYSARLDPVLRFDPGGAPDKLPELLNKARHEPLTDPEARLLTEALRRQDPWLECR
jgi:hypothetical protein